jgi:hypothetical protein
MDKARWDLPQPAPAKKARRDGSRQVVSARTWWLTGAALSALAILSAAYGVQPPRYNAEAQVQTRPRLGGLIGLRSTAANSDAVAGIRNALGQAQLLASRDLARRVIRELGIENDREFDPGPDGVGRALIFLGLKRDPARESPEDRVLEAFQARLRVSGPDRRGLLTIAFQSENPELAANAANRVAELYVDMRTDAQKAQPAAARIVAFAAAPPYPVSGNLLLPLTGAAMAALAFGALVTFVLSRLRLRERFDEPVVLSRPFGNVCTIARVKLNERLSERITARSKPPLSGAEESALEDPEDGQFIATAVARITAQRAHVRRGIRIVAPEPLEGAEEPYLAPGLARKLAREGRTIAICLDSSSFSHFTGAEAGPQFGALQGTEPLLRGLVAGRASFTEAICRDPSSRLHLLPIRQRAEADLHELQKIIDALAETYDYVVTMAPQIESNDAAKILARECEFALLESPECANGSYLAAEAQLIESCTGDVLLLGLEKGGQSQAQNAA